MSVHRANNITTYACDTCGREARSDSAETRRWRIVRWVTMDDEPRLLTAEHTCFLCVAAIRAKQNDIRAGGHPPTFPVPEVGAE